MKEEVQDVWQLLFKTNVEVDRSVLPMIDLLLLMAPIPWLLLAHFTLKRFVFVSTFFFKFFKDDALKLYADYYDNKHRLKLK